MSVRGRLRRLEAMTPPPSGSPEARARSAEAVETLTAFTLEHGDEIDRDYRERVATGQDDREALLAAKRAIWERTAEGREALEVLEAVQDRGGGTGYEPL